MKETHTKILGIAIKNLSEEQILEKIILFLQKPTHFLHIVSINPENVMVAQHDEGFNHTLNRAEVQIIDGVGVLLGGSILGIKMPNRLTGVDFMQTLLTLNEKTPLRVLFLGGKPNLAKQLSNCYQEKYPKSTFVGIEGFKNIQNPTEAEKKQVFSIVSSLKPHFIFAAFGSPAQELWFERHKEQLQGIICMGVGGSFDFISGKVKRAPEFLRALGLEWLFRLVNEPWRFKRQLRLLQFIYLVFKQKIQQVY